MPIQASPTYTAVSPNYLSDKQLDTLEIGSVITTLQAGEDTSQTNATNINNSVKKWVPPVYSLSTNSWTAGYWSANGVNYQLQPAAQYSGYLYCDGSEYKIKDYPHLYFVLKNTYGGSSSITLSDVTSDGAIIQAAVSGSQYLLYLKTDTSGTQVIPYDTAIVFSTLGTFSFLTANVTYYLAAPTSGSQTATVGTETTYVYRLIDQSGNNIPSGVAKTKANISASQPTYKLSKNFTINDWPVMFGTFKVPDYKAKKLVGLGPVYGSGTATIGNQVLRVGLNDELGNSLPGGTGGAWYIDQQAQKNEFSLGRVITTGMENVADNIPANVLGQVSITINMEDKPLAAAPEHNHVLLNSAANTDNVVDNDGYPYDPYLASYTTNKGAIDYFFPDQGGLQLSHTHGLSTTRYSDPTIATFDNNDSAAIGSVYAGTSTTGSIATLTRTAAGSGYGVNGTAVSLTGGSGTGASITWTGGTSGQVPSTVTIASGGTGYTVGNTLTVSGGSGATFTVSTIVPGGSYYAAGASLGYYQTQTSTAPNLVKAFTSSSTVGGIQITTAGTPVYQTLASYTLSASASPQVISYSGYTLSDVAFTLAGGGGSGGGTTVNGNAGQSTSLTLGTYTITAGGGGAGLAPSSPTSATGGAGGAGGTRTTPVATGLSYTAQFDGAAGTAGNGGQGWAKDYPNTTRTGGAGGNNLAISNTGTQGTSLFYSNITGELSYNTYTSGTTSNFSVPLTNSNYTMLNVYYELNGGSGGNGYAEADSGPGKKIKVKYNGNVNWCIGGAGSNGSQGTNNPAGGTGCSVAYGGSGGGGISGGGSGGGGGSATILFEANNNLIIASAGGGGGGGGYGADGANTFSVEVGQPNPITDNYQAVSGQQLFGASGATGNQSGCHGGGGGGGGGGVGTAAQPQTGGRGGSGGGAGHGGGAGGQRGLSSIRTDYVTFVSSGDNGSAGSPANGYISVSFQEDRSYWGSCGGGGGAGAYISGSFSSSLLSTITGTSLTVNVGYGGAQASSGGDTGGSAGGNGSATVQLRVITGYTGGITTTSVGDIIYSASSGVGSAVDAKVSAAGSGIGSTGGFNNGGYYARITGPANVLQRYIILNPIDTSNIGSIIFRVARGNGNNGGDLPEDPGDELKLYWGPDANTFPDANFLGTIVPIPTASEISSGYDGTSGNTIWHDYTFDLTQFPNAQAANTYFKIAQNRSSGGTDNSIIYSDNYGISQITFTYLPTTQTVFIPTAGYLPSDIASKTYVVNGYNSGITVNDVKFNLTSSIRLTPTPYLQPTGVIPLVERYHRVKYLIKAF